MVPARPLHSRPLNELSWGVCVPASCGPGSVERLLATMLARSHLSSAGMRARIKITEDCQIQDQPRAAFMAILTAAALLGTYLNSRRDKTEPKTWMMVFFVCAVYPYTGSGPLWPRGIAADTDQCRKNWWLSLLMLNNYIDSENICIVVSWYIPADFHCFCVSVLLYWLYKRCPRLAGASAVVITIIAIILPGVINYVYDMPAVQLFTYEFVSNPRASEHFHLTYIKSHTRAGAFIVGFMSGLIFIKTYRENSPKISKKWSILGSITALVIMLVVMVMGTTFIWRSYHRLEGAIYAALNRPIWTCGVAMLVLCCALGHVPLVKSFLCWYPWVPLSRLSYGLYLTHSLLISRNVFTTRNSQDNDYPELLIAAVGVIVFGCLAALVIWLLAEAPANNLLALLLRPSSRTTKEASEEKLPDTRNTSIDSLPSSSRGHLRDNLPTNITFSSKM
ncbi:hypothetical protein MSG28_006980 [Choristoneura fumiferana]|uniref:Uncharacterized protein n=2 Tax=Choristoneura fumiferana TaxID=7141 RepID=A0ACC0JMA5_CHOFU|nr:hypothetical protein MSG28_006980 [Choristoneura fumiferana]